MVWTPGRRQTLFVAGTQGYHTFRIPVLCKTAGGAILVFAEARRDGVQDWGQIDIVLRRSTDGGRTFSPLSFVVSLAATTSGNPAPVVDSATGKLLLLFCRNAADHRESLIFEGGGQRSVWQCESNDDGRTFSEPVEITEQVKPDDWSWYATGPGQGICLGSGRLLVPCDHARRVQSTHQDPVRSHVILSDDGGKSWRLGGVVPTPRSSECGAVEMAPGRVFLDFRNDSKPHTRGGAWSNDGGETFEKVSLNPQLLDPGCRAGIACCGRIDAAPVSSVTPAKLSRPLMTPIVVSHCFGSERRNLVLQGSNDGGTTFTLWAELMAGHAAYSDLLRSGSEQLLCAFETGLDGPYERIDLVTVDKLL